MPNIPEVQAMWTPGADNLKALLAGSQTADETCTKITKEVKEGIENQN